MESLNKLLERTDENTWSSVGFSDQKKPFQAVFTAIEYTGELTICKLDFENNIVSGIF